jgi:hypothetical protein
MGTAPDEGAVGSPTFVKPDCLGGIEPVDATAIISRQALRLSIALKVSTILVHLEEKKERFSKHYHI